MKDLTFVDKNLDINVRYRTSLISITDNGQDFTVMDIQGFPKDPNGSYMGPNTKALYAAFAKLPFNLKAFVDFATVHGLGLTAADSNGSNSVILVVTVDSSQS